MSADNIKGYVFVIQSDPRGTLCYHMYHMDRTLNSAIINRIFRIKIGKTVYLGSVVTMNVLGTYLYMMYHMVLNNRT